MNVRAGLGNLSKHELSNAGTACELLAPFCAPGRIPEMVPEEKEKKNVPSFRMP